LKTFILSLNTLYNRSRVLAFLPSFILVAFLGIYFRLYPLTYNPFYLNQKISKLVVHTNLKKSLSEEISKSHLTLSEEKRNQIINDKIKLVTKKENKRYNQAVSDMINQRQKPYDYFLLGADSFYYYRLTKRLLDYGIFSDIYKHGKFLITR